MLLKYEEANAFNTSGTQLIFQMRLAAEGRRLHLGSGGHMPH
jgi:hypothetical protein